jgi:formylglycine-generating enzyme required for sulfatase activity
MRHTSSRADIHDHANGFRVALEIAPTDQGKSSSTAVVPDTTHTRNVPPIAIAPFDTATARQHQGTWANYLGTSTVMVDSSGIRLMLIPPGEFDMGSTKQEVDRLMEKLKVQKLNDPLLDTTDGYLLPTGSPQHRVRITKAFYMGAREVTLGTFRQFVRETWHKTDAEKDGVDPAGEDDDEDLPRLKDSGHGAGRPRLTEIIDIGRRPAMVNHSVVNRTSVPKPASLASSLNLKWDA